MFSKSLEVCIIIFPLFVFIGISNNSEISRPFLATASNLIAGSPS